MKKVLTDTCSIKQQVFDALIFTLLVFFFQYGNDIKALMHIAIFHWPLTNYHTSCLLIMYKSTLQLQPSLNQKEWKFPRAYINRTHFINLVWFAGDEFSELHPQRSVEN